MTSTTMPVATGTKAIAAVQRKQKKNRTVPIASAKIAKSLTSAPKQMVLVKAPSGKEIKTATTETTTVHAIGMAGTVAATKTSTNFVQSVTV